MADVESRTLIAFDANFLIAAIRERSEYGEQIKDWMFTGVSFQISAIAWSEYLCGPIDETRIEHARKLVANIEPFVEEDAALAGYLFNETGRRSRSVKDC